MHFPKLLPLLLLLPSLYVAEDEIGIPIFTFEDGKVSNWTCASGCNTEQLEMQHLVFSNNHSIGHQGYWYISSADNAAQGPCGSPKNDGRGRRKIISPRFTIPVNATKLSFRVGGKCASCNVELFLNSEERKLASIKQRRMDQRFWNDIENLRGERVEVRIQDFSSNGYITFDDLRYYNEKSSTECKAELEAWNSSQTKMGYFNDSNITFSNGYLKVCNESEEGCCKYVCNGGYRFNDSRDGCVDIDECQYNNGCCHHICNNIAGSYKCSCRQGYKFNGNGTKCHGIDECNQNPSLCKTNCTNTNGSYNCSCRPGYKLDVSNGSCHDIDECLRDPCAQYCNNTAGSFKCSCSEGLVLEPDGRSCKLNCNDTEVICEILVDSIEGATNASQLIHLVEGLSKHVNARNSAMTEADIKDTVEVLGLFMKKMKNGKFNTTAKEAEKYLKSYINVTGMLLKHENAESWKNISNDNTSTVIEIIKVVEDMNEAMFISVKNRGETMLNVSMYSQEIDMALSMRRRDQFTDFTFPGYNNSDYVRLGKGMVKDGQNETKIGVSVVMYKTISTLFADENKSSPDVGSVILSVEVLNVKKLKEPVELFFTPNNNASNGTKLKCGFLKENGLGEGTSLWSYEGCEMTQNGKQVKCTCNHTTSFALLLNVHQSDISSQKGVLTSDKKALTYISIIGCSISIVFCILALISFTMLRIKSKRKDITLVNELHTNLIVAIGVFQIFYLAKVATEERQLEWLIINVLQQYFLIASFCWMLVEGINVYNKIVVVLKKRTLSKKLFYLIGWGVPCLFAAADVVIRTEATEDSYDLPPKFVWIFAAPILAIILVNVVVFISATYVLMKNPSAAFIRKTTKEPDKLRRGMKVTTSLMPLLGITWLFAFLAFDNKTVVFHYIAAIVNSLQGFFIFMGHCWMNDKVREALLSWLPGAAKANRNQYDVKHNNTRTLDNIRSLVNSTVSLTSQIELLSIKPSKQYSD